jgi:hypothetical protein
MKKIIIALIVFALPVVLSAQGFYLRAGTGYGLPAATTSLGLQVLHNENVTTANPSNLYSTKEISGSYGSGLNLNVGAGYVFTPNFIFDLEVIYLGGRKYNTNDLYTYTTDSYNSSETDRYSSWATGLLFNPSFVFSAGFGKAAPYGRFGIIAGSPKINKNEIYYSDLDGTTTRDETWVYKSGLALGFSAGIGMNWKITDNLDFYTEANFTGLTYYAKEGDITKYIYNGTDQLGLLTEYQKKIQYLRTYDPMTPYDPAKPQLAARTGSPLSSLSINVGIRFTLVKIKD